MVHPRRDAFPPGLLQPTYTRFYDRVFLLFFFSRFFIREPFPRSFNFHRSNEILESLIVAGIESDKFKIFEL